MESLEDKYIKNSLHKEELESLRKQINAETDETLASRMHKRWTEGTFADETCSDSVFEKIKSEIEDRTLKVNYKKKILTLLQYAAIFLLPVFILSTLYFRYENKLLISENITISTQKGEKANVKLPDGSRVIINAESEIVYSPSIFNKNNRMLEFEGEAYFDVAKNKDIPFIINSAGMKVRVLGTKFNLLARKKDTNVELSLEEGKVLLTSTLNNNSREMNSGEKAVLNKTTGEIVISKIDISTISTWRNNSLLFRNIPLYKVLYELEKNYGVRINYQSIDGLSQDIFSGTLPSNNISEALDILEKCYDINYTIIKDSVTFVHK